MILYLVVIISAAAVFGFANYYIGLRFWQYMFSFIPFLNKNVYWVVFWFISLSFILGRFRKSFIPESLSAALDVIGSYWTGVMLYAMILLPVVDIARFIIKHTDLKNINLFNSNLYNLYAGIIVFTLLSGILIYGTYQALHITVNHYDIKIQKNVGSLQNLHVAMISDLHLGTIVNKSRLEHMVDKINGLKPDIVLIGGDIIDDEIGPYIKQGMAETFKKLETKYGVYAVLGNHEGYGSKGRDVIISNFEAGGMNVLTDKYVKIADSFYLIGRNDRGHGKSDSNNRKTLNEIVSGVDKSLPSILLDHNPSWFNDAMDNNIDLQLSGHTHGGQVFPSNLINYLIYEDNWGYLKKGDSQLIVSSGIGTWGPPVRVGSDSEIVDINIQFGN